MTVSEYIFEFFAKKAVNTAFMVTGGQAMWLNDAIGKNKQYNIICTHHEQAAAMAADAYGRINNRPAIALVTAGPGSVNAMNGVVGGFMDSAPMIVISGQSALSFVKYQEDTQIRQHGVQGINIKPLVESICKYFITIDNVQKIKYYLEKAYYETTSGRPGPVWIDVPLDIQNMQIDTANLEDFTPAEIVEGRVSLKQAVKYAYELLGKSKRPLLIVGQGVALADAREEFYQYINNIRIPVITSRLGIDLKIGRAHV